MLLVSIVGLGLAASVLAALQWRNYIDSQQTHEVDTTTQEVRASLAVAIQRDEDLVQTLGGLVASGTPVTNEGLQALYGELDATATAGIVGVAYVEAVPQADLPRFEAQVSADPPLGIPESGVPAPAGPRARYCLIALAAESPAGVTALSASGRRALRAQVAGQEDVCTGPSAPALAEAATTGRTSVTLLDSELAAHRRDGARDSFFEIVLPVYPATTPASSLSAPTGRSRAVLGWAIGLYSAAPLLSPLVTTTKDLAVTVTHADASRVTTVASAGPRLTGALHRFVSVSADERWRASIAMVPSASATAQGVGVLADLLVIVLLAALIGLLVRSRHRAFRSIEQKNNELRHRSLHDTLTGLPNRDLIVQGLDARLARTEAHGGAVAVLLIDLDNFTSINNTYGHRVGDGVLVDSARRIERVLRPDDRLGRLAGDEFVILADASEGAEHEGDLAERVLDALSEPMKLSGEGMGVAVRITACIGFAVGTGGQSEELLRDADTALSAAKAAGKRRIGRFEPSMHRVVHERLAMTSDLRSAIDEGQFFLQFQPVFRLAGLFPIGVEALVRWRHPLRGVVPPLDFIPLAEETGLIEDLGHEVLRLACEQGEHWQRRGLDVFVSVNASALQVESDHFVGQVARALEDTGLSPDRLSIEVTESALMRNASETVRRLGDLKSLGIRLAIDDFGTGYSSLAYLRHFPVDILKIDRSFVIAMTGSPGGMALTRTMLELARALELTTVAEGIEDEAQLHALVSEHCDAGQGYLLSPPLDGGQIELFFDNARPRTLAAVLGSP